MKIKTWSCLLLLCGLLAMANTAQAGWIFEENQDGDKQTSYVQKNMYRLDIPPSQTVLFDLAAEQIFFLNSQMAGYWSGPPESFEKELAASIDRQMEKVLEKTTPEQREVMKQAMRRDLALLHDKIATKPLIEVKTTPDRAILAGFDTSKYEIWVDGQIKQELWLAEKIPAGHDLDLDRMGRLVAALSFSNPRQAYATAPEVMALYKQGWPLKTIEYAEDGRSDLSVVTRVEEKALAEQIFRVPANFRPMPLFELFVTPPPAGR